MTLRDELADDTGSSLVGFLQSGTGSAVRTVEEKFTDVVSVDDFGPISATTVNSAITEASSDGRFLINRDNAIEN